MRNRIYPKYRNCPSCGKVLNSNRLSCINNSECQSCASKKVNAIYKQTGWKKSNSKYIDVNPPYIKKCPLCGVEMVYNTKYTFLYSIRDNKKCLSCSNMGKNVGRKHEPYIRTCEINKKSRISAIQRIENSIKNGGQICPSYNVEACKIIDEYGEQNNYKFQHAMNGGEFHIKELGYFLDGYDIKNNVVIECYEKHHFKNGNLICRDINRQNEIIKFLNCKFISYNFIRGEFRYVN